MGQHNGFEFLDRLLPFLTGVAVTNCGSISPAFITCTAPPAHG